MNHNRPFRRGRGGPHPKSRPQDDLRNKINRIRTTREIEDHFAHENQRMKVDNEFDEDSISLSSEDENPPIQPSHVHLEFKVTRRSRSRSCSSGENVSKSRRRSRSKSKSKSRDKSAKKHKKEKKKHKKKKKSKDKERKLEKEDFENVSSSDISLSPLSNSGKNETSPPRPRPSTRSRSRSPIRSDQRVAGRSSKSRSSSQSPRRHDRYGSHSHNRRPHSRGFSRRPYGGRSSFQKHPYDRGQKRFHEQANMNLWKDNVDEFLKNISTGTSKAEQVASTDPPKEEQEQEHQEPSCDNISMTPLMKFVAKKLINKKNLCLDGPFQYSLLSVLSRPEWVAAKTVLLLEDSGFDTDWLYDTATIKGGPALKEELIEAAKSGKICLNNDIKEPLQNSKRILNQVILVIGLIVKYFTSDGDEQGEEDEEEEMEDDAPNEASSNLRKEGLGAVLEQIAAASQPPPPPLETPVVDQPINHWTMFADNIQASNLTTFDKLEGYLSQDLLRITSQNQEDSSQLLMLDSRPTKDAFAVARNMIMCWVNAGYNFHQLWNIVDNANVEELLPPKDPSDTSKFFLGNQLASNKRSSNKILAFKFLNQFKTMNKNMNERQIDYVVYKSILFVMRGLGKSLNNANMHHGGGANFNVSYNYLPPGLREMESKKYVAESDAFVSSTSENHMLDLSEDPMNIIIDPNAVKKNPKHEVMPRRKYFIVSVHLEWIVFRGKTQVYEITLQGQDMTTLELYIIPHALMKEPDLTERLGFTHNKNLNKYYFVQSGTGCVNALYLNTAVEKLVAYLESKRSASDENQNNGLVLLTKDKNHLGALLEIIPPDLTLNTIKGFGLLDSSCQLHETQFSTVGNECCYTTQVHVLKDKRYEEILSKTKADLLLKALEVGLQVSNPGYDSFVKPYCFPSDGSKVKSLRSRTKKVQGMYDLEIFISSELKVNKVETFLEGLYSSGDLKDPRPKSDVVAFKFCQALVDSGHDFDTLKEKHGQNHLITLNPEVILNQMDKPQRLKVLHQTHACLDFVRQYFRSCASK